MCLVFNSRFLFVDSADDFHIEFRFSSVVGEQAIDLLLYVGQLCVTEADHFRIVKNGCGKTFVPVVEFIKRSGSVAVAPGFFSVFVVIYLEIKADSAVFGHKYGLSFPGLTGGVSVNKDVFVGELIVFFFEDYGVLFVVVNVKYVGYNVEVTACINAGTGRIKQLSLLVDYSEQSVILALVVCEPQIGGFVKGAPAYNGGVACIPFNCAEPVGKEGGKIADVRDVKSPASVFSPYHIAETVGVIEE